MNRFIFSISTFFIFASSKIFSAPYIEAKAGYFSYTQDFMQDIYDSGYDIELCGAYPVWNFLQIYAAVGYSHCNGNLSVTHENTRVYQIPATVALQALFKMAESTKFYLMLGPRYIYFNMKNDSIYVSKDVSKSTVGGFFGTGFHTYFNEFVFFDIFGEYTYAQLGIPSYHHTSGQTQQISSYTIGAGLGFSF